LVTDIIIVGDLGAASNLIKNLLLLGNAHWPLNDDRFTMVFNQYAGEKSLSGWIEQEYVLRFWERYYGVDISDNLDIEKFDRRTRHDQPVIYINHSAFYQEGFDWFSDQCKIIYVRPSSSFALEWQIRAYHEKKSYKDMHDFSFVDKTEQIRYVNEHGINQFTKLNIRNMKEIMWERQRRFHENRIDVVIELEDLILNNYPLISKILDIDLSQCQTVLTQWCKRHWPVQNTFDWTHHDCFC
jgi:hypothetical protein